MKITREQLRSIVGEVLQEEKDYQSFFQAMLKKHGVSSPDEFKSDEEKKAFFNKVEDTWKGVSERLIQLKEDELTAKQQKIDLNKNGKVDGDDLSKLRAGSQTEGEVEGQEELPQTKILSKEGETLVKSGAGKMYNITKVNEDYDGPAVLKTGDKNALKVGEKITINSGGKKKEYKVVKSNGNGDFVLHLVESVNEVKLKEGRYDADLDKIEAAVKGATSFMNVGSELKKAGIKYDFTTSMIPMYMIKVSGNTIAICNKKYAAGAEREVKDIAIGLLN
jgi:hypothetical protein